MKLNVLLPCKGGKLSAACCMLLNCTFISSTSFPRSFNRLFRSLNSSSFAVFTIVSWLSSNRACRSCCSRDFPSISNAANCFSRASSSIPFTQTPNATAASGARNRFPTSCSLLSAYVRALYNSSQADHPSARSLLSMRRIICRFTNCTLSSFAASSRAASRSEADPVSSITLSSIALSISTLAASKRLSGE